ncbi:unnamed protein product [Ilex paraguariensis]|uniref:Uncharacterized protein n=1 Tax=Ilex paraguariensis TaxID=185542 RepID=A0ABC8UAU0_9AQUA
MEVFLTQKRTKKKMCYVVLGPRSVYKRDHALIKPESHVFSPLPDWTNTLGAYLISPAMRSHFVMYLAKMLPTLSCP